MEHFLNRIKKMWSDHTKIALREKNFERKIRRHAFCCLYVKLATVQI